MADTNLEKLKETLDGWIKDINSKLEKQNHNNKLFIPHAEEIDDNYDLIQGLISEVRKIKEELSALRMVQLLALKDKIESQKKN